MVRWRWVGEHGVDAKTETEAPVGPRDSRLYGPRALAGTAVVAGLVTLVLGVLMATAGPLLDAVDHWTADLRTAYFTYQLDGPHKRVAFIVINEEAIAEAQKTSPTKYRSPVDRGLLAGIVTRLDGLGVTAMGIDLIIDQPSEADKDRAFREALSAAKMGIVLSRLDFAEGRAVVDPEQRAYHDRFLAEAGKPSGYVTARSEIDGVVRALPGEGTEGFETFAEQLARLAGWTPRPDLDSFTSASRRVAWLRPPADNSTTFLTIPATLLILPPTELIPLERQLLASLAGRVAVVGVRFNDRTDRHRTPLTRSESDLMPGPEIHAHVVAQLLDGRTYRELTPAVQLGLAFVLAFAAVIAIRKFQQSDWLVGFLPLVVYIGTSVVLFWTMKLILPFAGPMLAWLGGVYVARFSGLARTGQDPGGSG